MESSTFELGLIVHNKYEIEYFLGLEINYSFFIIDQVYPRGRSLWRVKSSGVSQNKILKCYPAEFLSWIMFLLCQRNPSSPFFSSASPVRLTLNLIAFDFFPCFVYVLVIFLSLFSPFLSPGVFPFVFHVLSPSPFLSLSPVPFLFLCLGLFLFPFEDDQTPIQMTAVV